MAANNVEGPLRLEDLWGQDPLNNNDDDDDDDDNGADDNGANDNGADDNDAAPAAIAPGNRVIHLARGAYDLLGVTQDEVNRFQRLHYFTYHCSFMVTKLVMDRQGATTMGAFRNMVNGMGFDPQLILYILTWLVMNQLLPDEETVHCLFELTKMTMVLLITGDPVAVNRRAQLSAEGVLDNPIASEDLHDVWVHGEVVGPIGDDDSAAPDGGGGNDSDDNNDEDGDGDNDEDDDLPAQ